MMPEMLPDDPQERTKKIKLAQQATRRSSEITEQTLKKLAELDTLTIDEIAQGEAALHHHTNERLEQLEQQKVQDLRISLEDLDVALQRISTLPESEYFPKALKNKLYQELWLQRKISLQRPPTVAQRLRSSSEGVKQYMRKVTPWGYTIMGIDLTNTAIQSLIVHQNLTSGDPHQALMHGVVASFWFLKAGLDTVIFRKKLR